MKTRRIIALVIGILATPLLFLGLIDPLEGGIALIAAVIAGIAVRALSRVPVPALLWIPLATAFAFGVLALILAITEESRTVADQAPNPLRGVQLLVIAYRISVLVALAGAVVYLVRIALMLRGPDAPAADTWPTSAWGWAGVGAAILGLGSWFVLPVITTLFAERYPITDTGLMPAIGLGLVAAAAIANLLIAWLGRQRSAVSIAATALTVAATLLLGMFTIGEALSQ